MSATHRSTLSSIFESLDLIQEESKRDAKEGKDQAQGPELQARHTSMSEAAQVLKEKQQSASDGKSSVNMSRNKPIGSTSVAFSMVSASTVAAPKYWGGSGSKKGKSRRAGVKAEGPISKKKKVAKFKAESYSDKREWKQAKAMKAKGR
jgi:hypothetical protein